MGDKFSKLSGFLFFAFIGIFILSNVFHFYYLFEAIRFPSYRPSENPPWYFIHQSLATAIAYSLGLVVILALTRFFRKKDPRWANIVAGQALLWMGYPAFFGIIILLNTRHLLDPVRATTTWETHQAFSNAYFYFVISYMTLWFAITLVRRRRHRQLALN